MQNKHGSDSKLFGRLIPETTFQPVSLKLSLCESIGSLMVSTSEDDDSAIPAGYTYFGQFVDHDITHDTTPATAERDNADTDEIEPTPTSSLEQSRTPTLDLDSLYGSEGTNSALFRDGKFKLGFTTRSDGVGAGPVSSSLEYDLPRKPGKRTTAQRPALEAAIPEKRNDENLAVAQTHLMWMKFHNFVFAELKKANPSHSTPMLFEQTRMLVTQHYQFVVLHDFVRRFIRDDVYNDVIVGRNRSLLHHGPGENTFMPLEFSVAAFRMGHSMVRNVYDWNFNFGTGAHVAPNSPFRLLFQFSELSGGEEPNVRGAFRGNPTLPTNWIASFRRLYDFSGIDLSHLDDTDQPSKINFAKKINHLLASSLAVLPELEPRTLRDPSDPLFLPFANLAALNLRRGALRGMPSGQDVSRHISNVKMLTKRQMESVLSNDFQQLMESNMLYERTPLWLYILLEAASLEDGENLGKMGSIIVAETFLTLVLTSRISILSPAGEWEPENAKETLNSGVPLDTIPRIIAWIDQREPLIDPLQDPRLENM